MSERSRELLSELSDYKEQGVLVTYDGQQVDVDRRFTDMIVRDGPCTYMRNYSFDEHGHVTELSFERIKSSKE